MMSISQIGKSIGESVTLALNGRAASLRAKGEPVIHLGGGEPKSKAPDDAIVASVEMMNTGELRYAPASGTPAMKQAIIRYTDQYYGRQVTAKMVMASAGAKQAIMVALQAVLDPGDEVICPVPYWVSYPEMVKLCGAVPVPAAPADGSCQPRIDDIIAKVTARTKAVIINSPNNPSGAMYSRQFIQDIVEYCEKAGYYLIMDDIYQRLVFDGQQPANAYEFATDLGDDSRLIVINGVSKQYAMTGFRIGWAVANPTLIEVMANIQSHQTSGPAGVLQHGAVAAINGAQSSVDELRRTLEHNRDVMVEALDSFPGVGLNKPEGTFYCFCDFRHYDQDSSRLAEFLLDKVQVVTVPGVEFGMDGYLRLSYCGATADITEGIKRMQWALDPNAPAELTIGDRKLVRDWT